MKSIQTILQSIVLFIPFVLSLLYSGMPKISFIIAWMGSFYILYMIFVVKIFPLPTDLPFSSQLMRPYILTHVIFAMYLSITSIFHFMDMNGYFFLEYVGGEASVGEFVLAMKAQQYYLLGHTAFAIGLFAFLSYPEKQKWKFTREQNTAFYLTLYLLFFAVSYAISFIDLLKQLEIKFYIVSYICSVFLLVASIREKKMLMIVIGGILFILNFYYAVVSGWKEASISLFIILSFSLYPYAKRFVVLLVPVFLIFWFIFIPSFNNIYRSLTWEQGLDKNESIYLATQEINNLSDADLKEDNWTFLISRLTEIHMFMTYIETTEQIGKYYGSLIIEQSILSLIPRYFWKDKPITEAVSMQRAYDRGGIDPNSPVSAKPMFIVDSYLSGGAPTIILFLFILGASISIISRIAENWFGGYEMGSIIIFNSLFQEFWRTNTFEFLLNIIIWSFVVMYLVFFTMRILGYIVPNRDVAIE